MTGSKVKISAITILQLLAGQLDYATFEKTYQFDGKIGNPFARALDSRRVIAHCSIEQTPDEDDDWLTFEFGEPDPAIAPFKLPAATSQKAK